MSDKETEILAKTIFGEARGESLSGKEAVASVVLNRVAFSHRKNGYWWGNTISEVCRKPWQFSCWNENDPNRKILSVIDNNNPVYAVCKRIAMRAVAGLIPDKTNGATHYHTKNLRPRWSVNKIPCAEIGNHVFYNDVEGGC